MSKIQVAIVKSINGKYVAVDKNGKARVLKKGDSVFEGEEVRYDGQAHDLSGLDSASPFLLIYHVKSASSHLISYSEYLYFDSDISGQDNAHSTLKNTILDNTMPDTISSRGGYLEEEPNFVLKSQTDEVSLTHQGQNKDIMKSINEAIEQKLTTSDGIDAALNQEDIMSAFNEQEDQGVSNSAPVFNGGDFTSQIKEHTDLDSKENTTTHQATGKIPFSDKDTSDTHLVSFEPKEQDYKGEFTAKIENGEIVWDFKVDDKDIDSLKQGESLEQIYTITLDDGNGGVISKDVVVSIQGSNDAPIIEDKTEQSTLDDVASGNLLENSSDADGDELSVSKVDGKDISSPIQTPHGSIQVNKDGSYTFTPDKENEEVKALGDGESLQEDINFTIDDGNGGEVTKTLSITINGKNDAPTAQNDEKTIEQNTTLNGNVLDNDSDLDKSDTLSVAKASVDLNGDGKPDDLPLGEPKDIFNAHGVNLGKITINQDGTYEFKPSENFKGDVPEVKLDITDGHESVNSTLNIKVQGEDKDLSLSITPPTSVEEKYLPSGSEADATKTSTNGELSFVSEDLIDSLSVGGKEIYFDDLSKLDTNPISIQTPKGTILINAYEGDERGGKVSYTYTLKENLTHDSTNTSDDIDVSIKDIDGDTKSSQIKIPITNDTPTAQPDESSVDEEHPSTTNQNAITNDIQGADKAEVVGIKKGVSTQSPANDHVSEELAGKYGKITINKDGSYTYTLDENNTSVQALGEDDKLEDDFTYTIKDGDGDLSTSTIKINIKGRNDGVSLSGLDSDSADVKVYEKHLTDGSEADATKTSKDASFSFSSHDGLDKLNIGGQEFDIDTLKALEQNPKTISTPFGEITLKSFTGNEQGGSVEYSYTLNTKVNNQTQANATEQDFNESVSVKVTDKDGSEASSSLDIKIIDDTPTAKPDAKSISEDDANGTQISDNVIINDQKSADTPTKVVGVAKGTNTQDVSGNVGTQITGDHGKVTINEDGSYTYVLDNQSPEVQGLGLNESLTDTFTYTIVDEDGDKSTTTLTITINGTDDAISLEVPSKEVNEAALDDGSNPRLDTEKTSGSFTFKAPDGLESVSVGGESLSKAQIEAINSTDTKTIDTGEGTLVLNGYTQQADGTIKLDYTYTLKAAQSHGASSGGGEGGESGESGTTLKDNIPIIITDEDGSTKEANLVIDIKDDKPTAVTSADVSMIEDSTYTSTDTSNLLANDTQGADTSKVSAIKVIKQGESDYSEVSLVNGEAQVQTDKGTLIVHEDGSWSFKANNNLSNASDINEIFKYQLTDGDGDKSEFVNQKIIIQDGANPSIDNTKNTPVKIYEGEANVIFNGENNYNESNSNADKTFTSTKTHKLDFTKGTDEAGITQFTFDGITKTINPNGSETISTDKGTLKVYYDGTWEYDAPDSYAHEDGNGVNNISPTFTYIVTDTDGDTATGEQTIQLDDTLPSSISDSSTSLDEKFLSTGTKPDDTKLSITKDISIDVSKLDGSHDIKFNTNQSDSTLISRDLSSLGKNISYKVSDDGHTITLYTGTDENPSPVLKVEILNPTGTSPQYKATLLKAFDHESDLLENGNLKFDFDIALSDDDGDNKGAKLSVDIIDDEAPSEQEIITNEDTPKTITTNADATQDNTNIKTQATHGQAKIDANGKAKYTPDANYSGEDSFTYETTLDDGTRKETTVNVKVNPLAENTLNQDASNMLSLTSQGSQTDNSSVSKYTLSKLYNDEDTTLDVKMPEFSSLIKDTSTDKANGGVEKISTELKISGIPSGASIEYVDKNGTTQNVSVGENGISLDLDTLKYENGYFDYKIKNLPQHSNTDFTIKYEFTTKDTATIQGQDVSDTQKFEITQQVDMLGVADLHEDGLTLTPITSKEDVGINLKDIIQTNGLFVDNDGSETHTFIISGLPIDTVASKGTFDKNTGTLTISEKDLSTANIMIPKSDGTHNLSIKAISQENDHESSKNSNQDSDSDNIANDTDGQGYQEVTKNTTLVIKPVANDTSFNLGKAEGKEDNKIALNIKIDKDTLGEKIEQVTSITIEDIPQGAKLYKANGTEVSIRGGKATFAISDNNFSEVEGLQILPPSHSSKDITLKLKGFLDESIPGLEEKADFTADLKVKVTPVAEVTTSDTDNDSTNDVSLTSGHDFKLNEVHGKEDKYFNIGNNDGFNLKADWRNEDDTDLSATHQSDATNSEETFAHLTFGKGDTFTSVAGAKFKYTDASGNEHELTDSGSGVDVPVAYLDSLQVQAPHNKSGDFRIKVEAKTIDYDEDDSSKNEDISGEAFIDFHILGQADAVTVSVRPAKGDEDTGRSEGNTNNITDTAQTIDDISHAIPLHVKLTSSDKDGAEFGSESYNLFIKDVPDEAVLYYDGAKITPDADGVYKIEDFKSTTSLKIVPPHNSDVDFELSVSGQAVDDGHEGAVSTSLALPVKVIGKADSVEKHTIQDIEKYEDADGNGVKIALKDLYKQFDIDSDLSSYDNDKSETVSFKVMQLDPKFSLEGASFLGGTSWAVNIGDFNSGAAKLVVPKDFSGEINFKIDAITTEREGDSEKHEIEDAKVTIKPTVDGALSASASTNEDEFADLNFTFNEVDSGSNDGSVERLEAIYVKVADLQAHTKEVKINGTTVDLTSDSRITDGFIKINPNDSMQVLNKTHVSDDYTLGIKYDVKDTNGALSSAVVNKQTSCKVEVTPVTDAPTLSLDDISKMNITDTSGNYTKTITIKTPDIDSSEDFVRLELTGVPQGVEVENGVYVQSTDTWHIDISPDQAISTADGLNYTIKFNPSGFQAITEDSEVSIKAFIQDKDPAVEKSAEVTFQLNTDIDYTQIITETQKPAEITLTPQKYIINEEESTSVGDFVSAELSHDGGKFSVKINANSLPDGFTLQGATKIGDFWIADGSGGTDALNALLKTLTFTSPENFNKNDTAHDLSFKIEVTSYGLNGASLNKTITSGVEVRPISDPMDFDGITSNITTNEDVPATVNISLTNTADKDNIKIIDNIMYVKVPNNELVGDLTYKGQSILQGEKVTNPIGLQGEYIKVAVEPNASSVDFEFTPKENLDGNVSLEVAMQHKENTDIAAHDSTTLVSKQTINISVAPAADNISITTNPTSGNEDEFIQLNFEAKVNDDSESLKTIMIDNVPKDYLIYYGEPEGEKKLANNLGDNSWSIDDPSAKVWIKAPENVSGNIDGLVIKALSESNKMGSSDPLSVSIKAVADDINITPTDSIGEAYTWADVNLNASLTDIDGSESVTLSFKAKDGDALDNTAIFRLNDGTKVGAEFENGVYTLEVGSDNINNLQMMYHETSQTLSVSAKTKDGQGEGESILENEKQADMKLEIEQSFDIDVSALTQDSTIVLKDLSIPVKGSSDHKETLKVSENFSLDFSDIADDITNVEVIDLSLATGNITNLSVEDIKKMTDANNTLKITGGSDDEVSFSSEDGWTHTSSEGLNTFTKDGVTVELDEAIKHNIA